MDDLIVKRIFAVAILLLGLMSGIARCQEYNIQSFDGRSKKIYVLPDFGHRTLAIAYLKDTLHLDDFTGTIGEVSILNKRFLKIDYKVRGGSGIHLAHTLILCVNNKRLIQSLHITSLFHEEFIDFSKPVDTSNMVEKKTIYELDLNLTRDKSSNYKLKVKIHDEKKSKHAPQTNYNHDDEVTLNFDTSQNIFYSAHQDISRYFTVYNPKTQKETKQYVMGTFPTVKLGKSEYYYIKDEWYEKSTDDDLSKYSY